MFMISGGYLEQIIDNIAVFEVVYTEDKEETINAAIVDITNMPDELLEDYYYKFKIVSRNDKIYPYLPREANKDIYKLYNEENGQVEWLCLEDMGIDIERTHDTFEKIKDSARKARLMNNFLDRLYMDVEVVEGNNQKILEWSVAFDKKSKSMKTRGYNRCSEKQENIKYPTILEWENACMKACEDLVAEGEFNQGALSELAELNVTVYGLSIFLNKGNPQKYLLYKDDVYELFTYLGLLDDNCEKGAFADRAKKYFKYNKLLVNEIINLYDDDDWKKDSLKQSAVSRFISGFNIKKFLWDNCKFPY